MAFKAESIRFEKKSGILRLKMYGKTIQLKVDKICDNHIDQKTKQPLQELPNEIWLDIVSMLK